MESIVQRGVMVMPAVEEQMAAGFLAGFRGVTRKQYATNLRHWFAFCHHYGVPVLEAKRAHGDLYLRWLEEDRGLALSTICGRMSPVIGFYRYAIAEEVILSSGVLHVKRPWVERVSTTNYLSRTELIDVMTLAEKTSKRDHAICCLLGLNGMRVSELVGIDIERLGRDRGFYTVTILRKGGKTQTLPLSPRTAWAVEEHIGDRTGGPLFLNRRGDHRLPRFSVNCIVKRLVRTAGIDKRISPHSFRHSFVTLSLDAGVSSRDVQNSAGHSDQRMVSYYDRNKTSLARNATHALSAYVEGAA